MNTNILLRVTKLAEKTKDRILVVDPTNGQVFAIVSLDDYEKLILGETGLNLNPGLKSDLPQGKLADDLPLDKINSEPIQLKGVNLMEVKGLELEEEEKYYLEPIE